MEIVIFWIVLTVVVGMIGSNRTIGFWPAFLLSLFLSPLIGLIVVLASKSIETDTDGQRPHPVASSPTTLDSLDEQLRKLAALKADGLLTEEEFETQRKKLLSQ